MSKHYTTGEVAKLCKVSVRTVQYYDRQCIVSPSSVSTSGRRIYTSEDIVTFKLACLYKNLGFSLPEIKQALQNKDTNQLLTSILEKESLISKQIIELQKTKNKLLFMHQEIDNHQQMNIKDIEELEELLVRKTRYQRHEKKISILLVLLIFISFVLPFLGFPPFFFIITLFLFTVGLIYYHMIITAYICPNCYQKFTLSFIKDLCTLNNGKKGKLLVCPYCGHKSWMKETYKNKIE